MEVFASFPLELFFMRFISGLTFLWIRLKNNFILTFSYFHKKVALTDI